MSLLEVSHTARTLTGQMRSNVLISGPCVGTSRNLPVVEYANLNYFRHADQAEAAGKSELAKLSRESDNIEANEHSDRGAQALKPGDALLKATRVKVYHLVRTN